MYADVEDLLNAHGIEYSKTGNDIKCLCPNPNHNDSNIGSFSFNLSKGLGHCFACGYNCNTYTFNKVLGEKGRLNINKFDYAYRRNILHKEKEIQRYYKPIVYGKLYNPFYNNEVMNFLHSIGWSDKFIEEKDVKYCRYCEMIAENLTNWADEKPTIMKDRICIPIYKDGKLVNYECRTFVDDKPKVKYVRGCSSNLIYSYDNIDTSKEVILSEGIKNIGKYWHINHNIISSFGNQITPLKMELLNQIPKLTVFLDNDQGAIVMAKKLKEEYKGELQVTFCPKVHKNNGVVKGFDMNDCSLDEIRFYLNHTMSVDEAIEKLSQNLLKDEFEIFWR